jgi:hypothetical protein
MKYNVSNIRSANSNSHSNEGRLVHRHVTELQAFNIHHILNNPREEACLPDTKYTSLTSLVKFFDENLKILPYVSFFLLAR